jgi:starch synthase
MVTRLTEGKGLELVIATADKLLLSGAQLVMLGCGDRNYENSFRDLASRNPGRIATKIAFDETLAHQTIAGADFLLMPSQSEPCGLTQMYALRYGTVPVVHRTGGLADSVEQYADSPPIGDGFVFNEFSSAALLDSVKKALKVYRQKSEWVSLVRRGMDTDHSWRRSMNAYLSLYRELLGH